MSQSGNPASDDNREGGQASGATDGNPATGEDATGWFARSTLRVGLAIIGLVLLLFALGQAVGMDLLGVVVDALSTTVGRWLAIAFFALVLIVVALRGFDTRSE